MTDRTRDVIKDAIVEAGKTTAVYFSIYKGGHIEGTVSNEQNHAKIQNAQLVLIDENNKKIATVVTDTNGCYVFKNLAPGKYVVKCSLPLGYRSTDTLEKTIEVQSNGISVVDFIMFKYGIIEGTVVNEFTKMPIKNVRVELRDMSKRLISTSITDERGYYLFQNVESNRYSVKMVMPTDYRTVRVDE